MTTGEVNKKQIIGMILALIVALSSVFVSYALERKSMNEQELKQKVDVTTFKEAMTEYDKRQKEVIEPIKKDIEELRAADNKNLELILDQLKQLREDLRLKQNKD